MLIKALESQDTRYADHTDTIDKSPDCLTWGFGYVNSIIKFPGYKSRVPIEEDSQIVWTEIRSFSLWRLTDTCSAQGTYAEVHERVFCERAMSIEPQQETSTSSPPTVVVEPEHEPETTRLEGIWHFILDYSVPLLLGILIALIFANASVDDYEYVFGKHHAWAFGSHPTLLGHEVNISFLVNDIFMVFFFGLATCEVPLPQLPSACSLALFDAV